ncbi:MAG: DNA primase [Candidatus Pacebacteria bacterium]|nr:DNA primase [Candidatus Paceibacterota bacterium]MBP9818766.1 DNA primase [Candidatus Paceibacterota bacterium]
MSSAAETIKERLGIVEVVSSYTKIDKAGSNYKGRCPFHHEKSPSFFVSPARNSYYCFGCGQKGDIFTFVQEFEKVDFVGALKILAERAGVELQQFKNENKGENDRLRSVLETSTKFYEQNIHTPKNVKALSYLRERGLTDKTIDDWRIGFAENEWRRLHDFLLTKNVGQIDMEKVGLIKKSEKEGARADSVYDRFRARIMFPLFDPSSRVIGYSGRIFGVPDEEGPKYLNSPDTVLFNKSETLYGYHKAKDGIREWKYAILVEGQMDLLMCHQSGFTNTVATSGTSLTNQHLEKLQKLSDNLLIVFDADNAGVRATVKAWVTLALPMGMDVKVASLPKGEDPASLLKKDKSSFTNSIKEKKHIIIYLTDYLCGKGLSKDELMKEVRKEVVPLIALIKSPIESSSFISKVSVKTDIYESDLRKEVEEVRMRIIAGEDVSKDSGDAKAGADVKGNVGDPRATNNSNSSSANGGSAKDDIVLRRVGALLVWFKNSNRDVVPVLEKISKILPESDFIYFKHSVENSPEELLFEAEVLFDGSKHIEKDMDDLLYELEERSLKHRLSETMMELGLAEKKHDIAKAEELIKICQEISLKLSGLNKRKEG